MKKKITSKKARKTPKKITKNKHTRTKQTKPIQDTVNPDRLELSRNEILEFCDRVLDKWQKEPAKNARNIAAMLAVRTGIFFSDETSLKAIWSEIISWVYQLLYQNAQAQARKEGQEWAQVFSKIKNQ
jgi:hypothetical protein